MHLFTKKFKAYQQLEYSDCGIACIRMICHYYGKDVSLRTLRGMCDISRLGISIKDIVTCLRAMNFEVAAVKVSADEIERMPLPAILFWNQNHFVVLYKISKNKKRFYIADPAQGKLTFEHHDFMKIWKGESHVGLAVIMEPNKNFVKERNNDNETKTKLLHFIASTLQRHRWNFIKICLLTIITIVTEAYIPLLFQRTIDNGIAHKDIPLIWMLIASQFLMFIGQYVANCISHVINTKIGLRMHMDLTTQYLKRLILKPISFFDKKVNADLIQKLSDLERIKSFLVELPNTTFLTLSTLLVFASMLIYYNAWVFTLFVMSTTLSLLWTKAFLQKRKEIDYTYTAQLSDNHNQIYELIYGMTDIRTSSAQNHKVKQWEKSRLKLNFLSVKAAFINLYISCGNTFFDRMKDILITGFCAMLVVRGQMTIGVMMTISYICGRLNGPFNDIINMASAIQDANMSYERLDEILNEPITLPHSTAINAHNNGIDLRIDHLSFKYPGSSSPFILKDVSLYIPSGSIIALVGESGCGKTSLIKLLLGFYPATRGGIYVNNKSLNDIPTDDWLTCCGSVQQNGYIFSGSILENIALSTDNININQAKEAARIACIDDFFSNLAMGYHTKIGNNGLELSGGQRQRLLIARAVYKRPKFLFLDEATSSLDANNERKIVENLSAFSQGRTVIIAAHRLSTIQHAHQIAFFEHGTLKELGTHTELIARKGSYYKLVCNQMNNK